MSGKTTRPYHKTVVGLVQRCNHSPASIHNVLEFIRNTDLPSGHDEVMAAIDARPDFNTKKLAGVLREAKENIRVQKLAAEAKEKAMCEKFDFDNINYNLQNVAKDVRKACEFMEKGEGGWKEFALSQIKEFYKFLSQTFNE